MNIQGGNKIIFNTGVLYAKMAITILISLYATRLILNALGAEDYGIYVIVGGVISLLGFLNSTMAVSTQRHLSFSLGKKNVEEVKTVFANSIILHFILGVFLVLIFELFGQYLLLQKLTIDPNKLPSAVLLFHFVVASTFITILTVPYDGIVNAKENMLFISIVGILDSLLRLAIAFSLFTFSEDKLVFYGLLMMLRAIVIIGIKRIYCHKKYPDECRVHLRKYYNKETIIDLCSFAGWNLAGVLAYLFRNQGIAVVLNLFFNTVVIAAYGIANQVNIQLKTFSDSMIQAIQPQMVKDESSGDRERMVMLSILSTRFAFFIFSFIALPIYFQLEYILQLWLKNVPENTVIFCKLILLLTLLQQLRSGIMIASHAIGNIKEYQLYSTPIQFLSLPIGYFILKAGYPSYSILIIVIAIEILTVILNIIFFKKLTDFSKLKYVKDVVISCFLSLITTYLLIHVIETYIFKNLTPLLKFIIVIPLTAIFYASSVYFLSLTAFEKEKIKALVKKINPFH